MSWRRSAATDCRAPRRISYSWKPGRFAVAPPGPRLGVAVPAAAPERQSPEAALARPLNRATRPRAQTVTPLEVGCDKHPMTWNLAKALTKKCNIITLH